MIIYAKISQNIFLLVFLLTRLHDNELKLFIHDFEYSTIDNTGSRRSFRSSEARKKFNHTSLYEGQGPPPPTKSSPSFPALFYWPVFDWISSYQCSYWSVLWIWIDCHWIYPLAVWLGTVPGEWTLGGSECPHKASRFLQSKPKNKHYLWFSSTSEANSGTIFLHKER